MYIHMYVYRALVPKLCIHVYMYTYIKRNMQKRATYFHLLVPEIHKSLNVATLNSRVYQKRPTHMKRDLYK